MVLTIRLIAGNSANETAIDQRPELLRRYLLIDNDDAEGEENTTNSLIVKLYGPGLRSAHALKDQITPLMDT